MYGAFVKKLLAKESKKRVVDGKPKAVGRTMDKRALRTLGGLRGEMEIKGDVVHTGFAADWELGDDADD